MTRSTDIVIETNDFPLPVALVAGGVLLIFSLGVMYLFLRAILLASEMRDPAMLVVSLSALTYLAIVGAIATEVDALETIAAAGVGALAAAVASKFQHPAEDE